MPSNGAVEVLEQIAHTNKRCAETLRKYFANPVAAEFYEGEAQFFHGLAEILLRVRGD